VLCGIGVGIFKSVALAENLVLRGRSARLVASESNSASFV